MELKIVNRKGIEFTVLYSDIDHEIITNHKWYVGSDGYVRTVEKYPMLMHRILLSVEDSKIHVDHRDHNKLNNQRDNIRTCSRSQNMANRIQSGESKYLGVSFQRYTMKGKYHYCNIIATIHTNGKKKFLGRHKTEEDAAKAYDQAALQIHGEFANLNFK